MNACFYFHIFQQTQIFLDFLYYLINKEQLLDKIHFLFPDKIFNIGKKPHAPQTSTASICKREQQNIMSSSIPSQHLFEKWE